MGRAEGRVREVEVILVVTFLEANKGVALATSEVEELL